MAKPLSPDLDAVLAALDAKGVSAASNCRRVAMDRRDAARILVTVNRRGDNKDFDKMLREVHQLGFRRRGDAELLLLVHGTDGKSLPSRAKKAYLGTLRGALAHDFFNNPEHFYVKIAVVVLMLMAATSVAASMVCEHLIVYPIAQQIACNAKPFVWVGIKVTVAALMLSSMWSAYTLTKAAAKLGNKKAGKAMQYGKLPVAVAFIAAGTAMSWRAPYMFFVGCAAAAFVMRR
jgi:hypothetical protein